MKRILPLVFIISLPTWAEGIPKSESISQLIAPLAVTTNLKEIAREKLNSAQSGLDIWSGHYWPHYQSFLAVRYRENVVQQMIKNKVQLQEYKDYAEKNPLYLYYGKESLLSPAEKYDLLVGDPKMSLTKYSWDVANKEATLGKVAIWRGVCDGFASAAQMMPRPLHSVTVNVPRSNREITFYPEDLKALGSLLYARAQENVIFIGKRCRNAALSFFTGACDEINPGLFHQALVNRVGKLNKSFIADISPGKEVWNYPVKSYEFKYYNVFSDSESSNFLDVLEVFNDQKKFAKSYSRHKDTKFIVGVKAKVTYVDMRDPILNETDSPELDKLLVKEYDYDLELSSNFEILGGYSSYKDLPDFIWAPNDGEYPMTEVEKDLKLRSLGMIEKSQKSSEKGQPLSAVVKQLFEAARK